MKVAMSRDYGFDRRSPSNSLENAVAARSDKARGDKQGDANQQISANNSKNAVDGNANG